MFDVQWCWQVLLLKYRNGGRGLQKSLTDVPLEHHEECACVCKDDWDWPPTGVTVATRMTRDVKNEPLPLLQCSVSHPLPLEANKIPSLPCCPFANWIKQKRLESHESERIWLLWNTNSVALSAFYLRKTKKKKHWSRFWLLSLCSEDYIVLLLWVKNTEVFLALLPEAFLKFCQHRLKLSWKMEAPLFKVFFCVCKWAGSSCLTPLTPTLRPSSLCYPSLFLPSEMQLWQY